MPEALGKLRSWDSHHRNVIVRVGLRRDLILEIVHYSGGSEWDGQIRILLTIGARCPGRKKFSTPWIIVINWFPSLNAQLSDAPTRWINENMKPVLPAPCWTRM